jgi:hypothetical protein
MVPTGAGVYWGKLRISLKSFPASPWDAIWAIFASICCGAVVEPLVYSSHVSATG